MDYSRVMDERQKLVHENFPSVSYLSSPDRVARFMDWVTFWRRNYNRFAERYLGVKLHLYQHIILYLMGIFPSVCIVAARASAKSFIIAVFSCVEAILRPGSMVVIASATRKQARLIVSEKIKKEILPKSPLLNAEIMTFKDNTDSVEIIFHNGSSITVVPAAETARGNRSTVTVYEEFRMIKKNLMDTILSPFTIVRPAPFLNREEYIGLTEEPRSIYISSAWYKSHWMWKMIKDFVSGMLNSGDAALVAMDYSISLKHNIKTRNYLMKEKRRVDPIAWAIEYENQMVAENAKAYFTYEMLNRNRVMKMPFYPRRHEDVLAKTKNRFAIAKQKGEVRVVSCDLAYAGGKENDNSSFACIRLLPESKEYRTSDARGDRLQVKRGYRRKLAYIEARPGGETTAQAIRIKQLFSDFDADYCVIDVRNIGISVYDALAKVIYDEDRNIEYSPWTCMNDKEIADRIVIAGQLPVVFAVKANLEMNSRIAVCMRNTLTSRMFDLLVDPHGGVDELQKVIPEYNAADLEEQLAYERPFLETNALINEMISLEYTRMAQTNAIRIEERRGARKDRYTSVSYGNYFAELLEKDLFSDSAEYAFVPLYN